MLASGKPFKTRQAASLNWPSYWMKQNAAPLSNGEKPDISPDQLQRLANALVWVR